MHHIIFKYNNNTIETKTIPMFQELEQMAHENKIITPKERAVLKTEAQQIAPFIRAIKGWRQQLIEIVPEYNSIIGYNKMSHILLGVSTDVVLLNAMKKLLINNNVEVPGIIEYDKKGRYIKK